MCNAHSELHWWNGDEILGLGYLGSASWSKPVECVLWVWRDLWCLWIWSCTRSIFICLWCIFGLCLVSSTGKFYSPYKARAPYSSVVDSGQSDCYNLFVCSHFSIGVYWVNSNCPFRMLRLRIRIKWVGIKSNIFIEKGWSIQKICCHFDLGTIYLNTSLLGWWCTRFGRCSWCSPFCGTGRGMEWYAWYARCWLVSISLFCP